MHFGLGAGFRTRKVHFGLDVGLVAVLLVLHVGVGVRSTSTHLASPLEAFFS